MTKEFKPDFTCDPPCASHIALVDMLGNVKKQSDEIERLEKEIDQYAVDLEGYRREVERLEMRNRDAEWLAKAFQQLATDNNILPDSTQLIAAYRKYVDND